MPTTVAMIPGIVSSINDVAFTMRMQELPASVMYVSAWPAVRLYQNVTCVGVLRDARVANPPSPLYDCVPFPANTDSHAGVLRCRRYTTCTLSSAMKTGSKPAGSNP